MAHYYSGSLSEARREDIRIIRTGQKFPPHKYDPDASPDMTTVAGSRRNGQTVWSRRVLQPTRVCLTRTPVETVRRLRARAARASRASVDCARVAAQVSVDLQLNAIYNLVEKSQQLNADFMLISNWFDSR